MSNRWRCSKTNEHSVDFNGEFVQTVVCFNLKSACFDLIVGVGRRDGLVYEELRITFNYKRKANSTYDCKITLKNLAV